MVGGGIAGIASACVLAERGAEVTLYEKENFLGGRAGAWTDRLADGTSFEMERGFHAFFRQYYNLRSLLQRIDPELRMLVPARDYPILGPDRHESFANLSKSSPLNVAQLVYRTESLKWRDLLRVNVRAAMAMLAYDQEAVYRRYDGATAKEYLDSLRFPPEARRMMFDVFAHSFFNPEEEMSAAELLMMFHFYFTGNPEGLVFDLANAPFSTALWNPLSDYLQTLGVKLELNSPVMAVEQLRVSGTTGQPTYGVAGLPFDAVVLALSVSPLKQLVEDSPQLDQPDFRREVASLDLTNPFAVWRLWLDRRVQESRAPFVGTTGVGVLDNISVYELIEDESKRWADEVDGSVIELHGYSLPHRLTESEVKEQLLRGLHRLYPETKPMNVIDERFLFRRDCPAFGPNSWSARPGVATAHRNLMLAGDFVRLPIPSALMERAAASGFIAANQVLAPHGVASEPIWSVPLKGLFNHRVLGKGSLAS